MSPPVDSEQVCDCFYQRTRVEVMLCDFQSEVLKGQAVSAWVSWNAHSMILSLWIILLGTQLPYCENPKQQERSCVHDPVNRSAEPFLQVTPVQVPDNLRSF